MQKVILKFLVSISFIAIFVNDSKAISIENELVKADSLYNLKLYTESINIYQGILNENKATPSMLLKMARIEEGLKNYGTTVFYLEKYFQLTEDKNVLYHIENIASSQNLNGYSYDFPFYFSHYYHKWRPLLLAILTAILIVLSTLMIKNKNSLSLKRNYFVFIVITLVLIGVSNNLDAPKYAIISGTPTFLLEGPSAGANVVDRINANHKIVVKGSTDVWTETEWAENKAYIKTDRLKKL
jgi:hypothetical protein